ncbi:MAG: inositol monophosphatase family protein, partial [Nanoarchaeota archaeon]
MNEAKKLERYLSIAVEGALLGRDEMLRQYGKKQELFSKGGVDGYTLTDQELEERTRDFLRRENGIEIYGEEQGGNENAELLWVIDKIDGTPNFRSGVPLFGSAVSLLKGNKCLVTAIYLPALDEMYSGCKDFGS